MQPYSALRLLGTPLSGHRNRSRAWRDPEPAKQSDIVIVSGGGHGPAMAAGALAALQTNAEYR